MVSGGVDAHALIHFLILSSIVSHPLAFSLPRLHDIIKIIYYYFEMFGRSRSSFGAGVLGCSECILWEASGVIFHFLSCLCEMFHTSVNKVFSGM